MKYRIPPLWPSYIGERRTTFAKAYGDKSKCYCELFGLKPYSPPTRKKKEEACMESRLWTIQNSGKVPKPLCKVVNSWVNRVVEL